jgi:hypothetical protein
MTLLPYSVLAKCGKMVFAIFSILWFALFIEIFHRFIWTYQHYDPVVSLFGSLKEILPPLGLPQLLLFQAFAAALDLDVRYAEETDKV